MITQKQKKKMLIASTLILPPPPPPPHKLWKKYPKSGMVQHILNWEGGGEVTSECLRLGVWGNPLPCEWYLIRHDYEGFSQILSHINPP